MNKAILVDAPNRIHITLLAMDEPIYRINGGIGFAINCNNLKVIIRKARKFIIVDRRKVGLTEPELERLTVKLRNTQLLFSISHGAEIQILDGPPPHQGFGSGTSTALSFVEGYLKLAGINASSEDIVNLSQRGGTSGIGVNIYFN